MQRERLRTQTPVRAPGGKPSGGRTPLKEDLKQEIAGVVLAAIGIWLYVALLRQTQEGIFGGYMAAGVRSLVGQYSAWVVPGLLVLLGGYLLYLRRGFTLSWRFWGAALLLLCLVTWTQVFTYPLLPPDNLDPADPHAGQYMYAENGRAGLGGGLVGWATGLALTRLFGPWGRHIVLAAGVLVGLMLAFEVSVATITRWLAGRAVKAGESVAAGAGRAVQAQRERLAVGRAATTGAALGTGRPEGLRPDAVAEVAAKPKAATTLVERYQPVGAEPVQPAAAGAGVPFTIHRAAAEPAAEKPAAEKPAAEQPAPGKPPEKPAEKPPGPSGGPVGKPRPAEPVPVKMKREGDQWQLALDPDKLKHESGEYHLPPLNLLKKETGAALGTDEDFVRRARTLEHVLSTFGVPAKVVEVHPGPTITRFELTVEAGVRINKVANLADDLAYHLAAQDIRIEAPIPGKRAIGIEVPNEQVVSVFLRDVLEGSGFLQLPVKMAVGFGKDIAGKPILGDLEKMPHLLIAGATGSGKSVCMNTIICSLLMKARPDELKMLMVDPKRVELAVYDGIPHLLAPVCTDPRKAAGYLKWAVKEMEARYDLLAASGTRNITGYNRWVRENPGDGEEPRQPLPYIVIFIDELADLMMVAPVEVEDSIIRLAQMARACGIHLVIATQRPSVDVITGLIKANIPSRIAFAVASGVDSRTILDMQGAEKLMGKGDMLYHPQGLSKPIRAQGAFVSDKEVEQLVGFVKQQARPNYQAEAMDVEGVSRKGATAAAANDEKESAADSAFPDAVHVVIEHGQASVSILQRRLRCNYTKAARLIDMMYERGFIGPPQGPKPREVLIGMAQWEALFGAGAEEAAAGESDEAE